MSDLVQNAKKAAAYAAVDQHVKTDYIVGIGSGSTVVFAVERLAERVKKENLKVEEAVLQEKIVASNAKKLIIIADYTKDSEKLGDQYKKGIPIEVVPIAYVPIMKKKREIWW
nr:unnamed protein product [Callosobruchus analis]CAI5864143.1 unnamed protein product [Callosobruchus analis]